MRIHNSAAISGKKDLLTKQQVPESDLNGLYNPFHIHGPAFRNRIKLGASLPGQIRSPRALVDAARLSFTNA